MGKETNIETVVPEFYANGVRVSVSAFEVELQAVLSDSEGRTKGALNLRMSPQTAWVLSMALGKHLAMSEEKFGKIPIPDELRKAAGA